MKYEWKKNESEWYQGKNLPSVIELPAQNFITIAGTGNPNEEAFSQRVGVLYSLAYQIKMRYKALCAGKTETDMTSQYQDYTVFPLEGIWTSAGTNPLEKEQFIYTIMIKQPDFITKELYETAFSLVAKKKPHPLLQEAAFKTIEDGLCVQILHKGSYDDEPESFAKMDRYVSDNGWKRRNSFHREIYLAGAQKGAPEHKKTILRYQICKN